MCPGKLQRRDILYASLDLSGEDERENIIWKIIN